MGKNGNSAGYSDYGRTVVYTWKRQGLRRVIQNVIKNGLDHGEKKISIVLECDQNQAVLRISNQVTHPEQINIDQVFEHFIKQMLPEVKHLLDWDYLLQRSWLVGWMERLKQK